MVAQAKKQRPLSPREIAFAENLLAGMNNTEALKQAAGNLKWTQKAFSVRASRMASDPRVKQYVIDELEYRKQQRRLKDEDVLTRIEKRGILATIARGKLVEPHNRMQAIKLDNEMTGDAVLRIEQELTLGVILKNLPPTTGLPKLEKNVTPQPQIAEASVQAPASPSNGAILGPMVKDLAKMGINVAPSPQNAPESKRTRVYEE